MSYNALWIDDVCEQPADDEQYTWTRAFTFHEAIVKLELLDFEKVSFDHKIGTSYGNRKMTGYDIVCWLAERATNGDKVPHQYEIHSCGQHDQIQGVIDRYLTV